VGFRAISGAVLATGRRTRDAARRLFRLIRRVRRHRKIYKSEVRELLALAEQADQAQLPDGVKLPEEIRRREGRLAAIAAAKAKIEARARERFEREQAEFEAKRAKRQAKAQARGQKPGGKPPKPPEAGPRAEEQINLTDEESRIMKVSGSEPVRGVLSMAYASRRSNRCSASSSR
jgi:parvulin-like peptidyl-prolyl isomerase